MPLPDLVRSEHDEPMPGRVLVMVAHPDDIDFGAAGTAAVMTDHGVDVVYGLATDGEAGEPAEISAAELKRVRRAEQTAAATIVGVSELHWLGFPDGAVVANLELRRAIACLIRKVKPDLVIGQSPVRNLDRIYGAHPDHIAVGEATVSAVYPDSRNARSFPELLDAGLEPHTVRRMWLMLDSATNLHVDIGDAMPRKVEALLAHHSQTSGWADRLPTTIPEWAAESASAAGLTGRLVESFRSIDTS